MTYFTILFIKASQFLFLFFYSMPSEEGLSNAMAILNIVFGNVFFVFVLFHLSPLKIPPE